MAGETVLIVEDTPVNLKLTRILLRNEGYDVHTAVDAEQAVEMLGTLLPDVILVDIQLPGMNGLQLTRHIRRDPRLHGVVVIAVTASVMKGDEYKALDAGCDAFISKPIDTRSLGPRIRELLDQRAARQPSPPASEPAPPGVPEQRPTLAEAIREELSGRRVALLGFAGAEADRLCAVLARVRALPLLLDADEPQGSASVRSCQAVLFHVRPETMGSSWLAPRDPQTGSALVLVGRREDLLTLDPSVQRRAFEFLVDDWQPEEALMRIGFALSRAESAASAPSGATNSPPVASGIPPVAGRPRVLIADDDAAIVAVLRTMLKGQGIDTWEAYNGQDALKMIRELEPHAALLDVNMPGIDGFSILAAIRDEKLPVRVLMLTARQQENDVVLGFTLGADDYVVKPFSPPELVARLKRLLAH
jgi:DNA-binding response OmpR family regulator